jgi:hypothetical protein
MRIIFSAILLGVTVSFSFAAPLLDSFKIQFNWDLNSALEDAIPVYSDNEDIRENPDVFEFAYLFYSNPKIKLQVYTTCTNNFILLINARNTEGNGFDTCYYNYAYIPGTVIEITIPITNYISKYHFTWEWTITAIPICNTGAGFTANTLSRTTEQHLYVILEEPQTPMNPPWAGVLEYACEWAEGENDIEEATTKLTNSLYNIGFNYDSAQGKSEYCYTDADDSINFDIPQLLADLEDPNLIFINCVDMASALVTFSNAIGFNLSILKISADIDGGLKFPVNYIDPIGLPNFTNNPFSTSIRNDCRTGGFKFHALTQTIYEFSSDTLTWDATFRIDTDSNPDNVIETNPPSCGIITSSNEWAFPCKMHFSAYLNHLIDNWVKPSDGPEIDCNDRLDCIVIDNTNPIKLIKN